MEDKTKTVKNSSKTKADIIWDEIKDIEINIYALNNQTIEDHVVRKSIPGNVVFLHPKSPAIISILEEAIGDQFVVSVTNGGFITVERNNVSPLEEEEEYVYFPRPNGKFDKIPKKNI